MTQVKHVLLRWLRAAGLATACAIVFPAGGASAYADVAFVSPTKDATLHEEPTGNLANGSGPGFFAGRINSTIGSIRRALIAFDVAAAVPSGSTVMGVRLRLNISATIAGQVAVGLHRAQADWGEGASFAVGGNGAPSSAGDSTWLHRFYDDTLWNQPGGDFDPAPLGVAIADQPGPCFWESTPELVADVQSWLDQPEVAFGWVLVGDETLPATVKRFDSREHPEEANRPLLEVTYAPPCVPAFLGAGSWRRHCASQADGGSAEPILACAAQVLGDLGLAGIDACEAVLSPPPRSCEDRAAAKLAVLVLNVCAGRLQTSCPVESDDGECVSHTLGDRLQEIARLLREGDCRRASGCAGVSD